MSTELGYQGKVIITESCYESSVMIPELGLLA